MKQLIIPNLNIGAQAGWCLNYVREAVEGSVNGEDNDYDGSAQEAYEELDELGLTRAGEPPVGYWVPIWFTIDNGQWAGLGHVAWAYNHGNGQIDIHDSEVHRGAKVPYNNIGEVFNWFGSVGTNMTYLGWSVNVAGKKIIEDSVQGLPQTNNTSESVAIKEEGAANMFIVLAKEDVNQYIKKGQWVIINITRGTYTTLAGGVKGIDPGYQLEMVKDTFKLATGKDINAVEWGFKQIAGAIFGLALDYRTDGGVQ